MHMLPGRTLRQYHISVLTEGFLFLSVQTFLIPPNNPYLQVSGLLGHLPKTPHLELTLKHTLMHVLPGKILRQYHISVLTEGFLFLSVQTFLIPPLPQLTDFWGGAFITALVVTLLLGSC